MIRPTIPENYKLLLDRVLEGKQRHTARVIIKDYGVRKSKLWVHGEIQLGIPIDFYYKHMTRHGRL